MQSYTQDASASVIQHLLEETPSRLFPILRKSTERLSRRLQAFGTHLDTLEADLSAFECTRAQFTRLACQGAFLCQALDDAEAEISAASSYERYYQQWPALPSLFSCGKRFSTALTHYLNRAPSAAAKPPETAAPPDGTRQT